MTAEADLLAEAMADGRVVSRDAEARELLARLRQRMFARATSVSLGRYRNLARLGEGGMGIVYTAEDPRLRRRVALKVLRAGQRAEGLDVLREARKLARLAHPNVVAVLDAGVEGDEAFVAMELVEGPTLAAWLAAGRRRWREIVAAFAQAGRGLAAAHRRGLVHRDFKPSNAIVGADGRVRVTDFGLATGQGGRDTPPAEGGVDGEGTLRTAAVVGTLGYSAPEQLQPGASVDARADQFALCVALFEALHGAKPFGAGSPAAFEAAVNAGPPPVTAKVPAALGHVIQQGLAAAPPDRFADMDALVRALEAAAAPPRGRPVAIVAVVGLGAIAIGAAAVGPPPTHCAAAADVAARWSGHAVDDARRSFAATELPYADAAFVAADADLRAYATAWGDAYVRACDVGDERQLQCLRAGQAAYGAVADAFVHADARTVEHAHATAAGLPSLDACRSEAPARPAAVEQALAEAHARLAIRDLGGARTSLADLARDADERSDDALLAEVALIRARVAHLDGDIAEAEEHARAAYYAAQSVGDDKNAAMAASLLVQIVGVDRNDLTAGGTWAGHARTAVARWGGGDADVGYVYLRLGSFARSRGNFDDAVALAQKAIDALEPLGRPLPLADALTGRAVALSDVGEFATAIEALDRARALMEGALPADHPRNIEVLLSLGVNQISRGNVAAAETAWTEALRIADRQGEGYYKLGFIESNLGGLYINTDRPDEAAPHLGRAIEVVTATFGPDHPALAHPLQGMSSVHIARAEYDEAVRLAERALVIITAAHGEDHHATATAKAHLAEAHKLDGNAEQAEMLFGEALATMVPLLGPDHVRLAGLHTNLGELLRVKGDAEQARAHLDEAIRLVSGARGADSPDLAYPLTSLGLLLAGEGDLDGALAVLHRGQRLRSQGTPWERADSELALARALWGAGDRVAARGHADAARDLCRLDAPARCAAEVEEWVAAHGAA